MRFFVVFKRTCWKGRLEWWNMTAFKEFHILYHKVWALSWEKVPLGCFLPSERCTMVSVLAGDKDSPSGIRADDWGSSWQRKANPLVKMKDDGALNWNYASSDERIWNIPEVWYLDDWHREGAKAPLRLLCWLIANVAWVSVPFPDLRLKFNPPCTSSKVGPLHSQAWMLTSAGKRLFSCFGVLLLWSVRVIILEREDKLLLRRTASWIPELLKL